MAQYYYKSKDGNDHDELLVSLEEKQKVNPFFEIIRESLLYFIFSVSCMFVLLSSSEFFSGSKYFYAPYSNLLFSLIMMIIGLGIYETLKFSCLYILSQEYIFFSKNSVDFPSSCFAIFSISSYFKVIVGFAVLFGEIKKAFEINELALFFKICDNIVLWNHVACTLVLLELFLIFKFKESKFLPSHDLVWVRFIVACIIKWQ